MNSYVVLVLFSCDLFPGSRLTHLLMLYTDLAHDLADMHLPSPLVRFIQEKPDLFDAVVYSVPELISALLGGTTAACLAPRGLRPDGAIDRDRLSVNIC